MTPVPKGPLPIIVGVTGHTDLRDEDTAALTAKVRALLEQLRTDHPHTPIELISALAEGADRLAARVALDLGMTVRAALPMPRDEYARDFSSEASVREFDELLARTTSFVLDDAAALARPDCYARTGAFVVRHAHVLLALWDGTDNGKIGGTSEIVRFALAGIPRAHSRAARLLSAPDTASVFHIVTPRKSAAPPANAFESKWLAPGGPELLRATESFNTHAADVPLNTADPLLDRVYTAADALALTCQRKSTRAIKSLFIVGWLSILAFESFTDLKITIAVIPYVLLFLMAYGVYVWLRSRGVDDRRLEYRSLAEAARVLAYWRQAGIGDSVADHYMRHRTPGSEWIQQALLALELDFHGRPRTTSASDAAAVADTWVEDQRGFFTRAGKRDHDLHHRLDRVAGVLMGASMLLLVVLIGMSIPELMETASAHAEEAGHDDNHWLVVLIGVLAAGAGALHGYGEKRALHAQEKRYAQMRAVYDLAHAQLRQPAGAPAEAVLRELGREALEENADWVALHRDRPLEPPGPGH